MRCVRWMVRSGSTEARRECFAGRHWRTIGLGRRGPRRALRRRLCVFRRSTAAALVLAHTNKLPRPCARAGGDSDGPLVRVARRLARQCCKRLGAKRLGYMSVLKYRDLSRGEISESSALLPSVGPLVAWRAAATCVASGRWGAEDDAASVHCRSVLAIYALRYVPPDPMRLWRCRLRGAPRPRAADQDPLGPRRRRTPRRPILHRLQRSGHFATAPRETER